MKKALFPLLISSALYSIELTEPLNLDLKNASYQQGVFKTDQGGVVYGEGIRIQAKKIIYTNKLKSQNPVHSLYAEGQLMLVYQKQIFIGDSIEYDFITQTGVIKNGKTSAGLWYLGAETIYLDSDGGYRLSNAYITTSENRESIWETRSKEVTYSNEKVLTATNISVHVNKTPIFLFPWFQNNMQKLENPALRYQLTWDKELGPRLSVRYRLISTPLSDLYFRVDYRIPDRYGGAIETEFYSQDRRTVCLTKNYAAHDKSVPDQQGINHFRFQGLFHTASLDERIKLNLTYDRISDEKMPENFTSDDFEINTRMKTLLTLIDQEDNTFGVLRFQPRINNFQSINQQLPLGIVGIRPYSFGDSGIISENRVSFGYLNYVYADQLKGLIPNFRSSRIETINELYRPFHMRYGSITPRAGAQIIYYGNSPCDQTQGQIVFHYDLCGETELARTSATCKHSIEPYFNFTGLAKPTIGVNNHYIFNIDDGLYQINLLKIGVQNSLYFPRIDPLQPSFTADLYTYAFFNSVTYQQTFPKIYANIDWNFPYVVLNAFAGWNLEEHVLDFSNFRTSFTINEDFAMALELRYRSKYAFRKSDYDNFVYEFARPLDEILSSPLSDRRYTVLGKMQLRLSPKWILRIQSLNGFGRTTEPGYNAQKVDIIGTLTSHWKMRVSYEHLPNDDRFTYSLKLVK